MNTEELIELTLFVYKVSEKWNKKTPIQFAVRREAIEILKNKIKFPNDNRTNPYTLKKMINLLYWARKEKLLTRGDFIILREFYSSLKESSEIVSEKKEKETVNKIKTTNLKSRKKVKTRTELKDREKRIISILKKKKRVQIKDLKEEFPNITKRTLRRDIESLLQKKIVLRKGEWNKVFYVLSNKQ